MQAVIEDVRPPHGFRQIQFASLTEWNGSDSTEFAHLCTGALDVCTAWARNHTSKIEFPEAR